MTWSRQRRAKNRKPKTTRYTVVLDLDVATGHVDEAGARLGPERWTWDRLHLQPELGERLHAVSVTVVPETAPIAIPFATHPESCDFCGRDEGHTERCAVTKFGCNPKPPYRAVPEDDEMEDAA